MFSTVHFIKYLLYKVWISRRSRTWPAQEYYSAPFYWGALSPVLPKI